jgi:hypothetical protein
MFLTKSNDGICNVFHSLLFVIRWQIPWMWLGFGSDIWKIVCRTSEAWSCFRKYGSLGNLSEDRVCCGRGPVFGIG